jgi:hypothetical protein
VLSNGPEYLELELACVAIAACEAVAWLRGNWGKRDGYTECVVAWVRQHPIAPPAELVRQAVQAPDRIASPPSELLEEAEGDVDWDRKLIGRRLAIGHRPMNGCLGRRDAGQRRRGDAGWCRIEHRESLHGHSAA